MLKALTVVLLAGGALGGQAFGAASLVNGGFETPLIGGSVTPFQVFTTDIWAFNAPDVPGWATTDVNNAIEIWRSGAADPQPGANMIFNAFEGNQFAEINAFSAGTLSTTVDPTLGNSIGFSFAHRGRDSDTIADVIRVDVLDLGADSAVGGGDDTPLMGELFSTTRTAWSSHFRPLGLSTGNRLLLTFNAVSTAGGILGRGNFLDAVAFGENVVPAPGSAILAVMFAAGVCPRRRRS